MANQRDKLNTSDPFKRNRPTMREFTDAMLDEPEIVERVVEVPTPVPTLALDAAGNIPAGNFTLTPVGLVVSEGATFEEWLGVGGILRRLDTSLQWLIGDWMNYGERVWGQTYQQVAALTGYEVSALRNFAYVASKVDLSLRSDKLSFGHHQVIAPLRAADQHYWIGYAAGYNLSVVQLRQAINGQPPTPSAKDDPIGYFHGSLMDFYRKAHKAIKAVGQGERKQMAAYLRQLADEIESPTTGGG